MLSSLCTHLGRIGVALLLCAAVLAVSACGCSRTPQSVDGVAGQSQLASGTADASSAVSATGSVRGAERKKPTGSAKPSGQGLSNADVKAIDAELTAIEKELDSMALPSDSDFGGIESGLE